MQVAPQSDLAAMQDIITPDPIGLWPLAYGYYLLALLLLLVVCGLVIYLKRRRKHLAAKREALKLLSQLEPSDPQLPHSINALLKRSAMSYLPREQVASLQEAAWYDWLKKQVPGIDPNLAALLEKRFQSAELSADEASQLLAGAQAWLQQALPLKQSKEAPCSR
ncbi:DUF4381 domain-containing protein [Shewanella marisflavi]|uniref:DUF4381 domain-containing protein n=1 Tax=Shewanella marisflavi TaxID=260364 RepID=UPI003AB0D6A4